MFMADTGRVFEAVTSIPLLFGGVLLSVAGTIYCAVYFGPWALLGALVLFLFYPYQVWHV